MRPPWEAIDRISLGVAVTIEFAGPLLVAVIGSRRIGGRGRCRLRARCCRVPDGLHLPEQAHRRGVLAVGALIVLPAGVIQAEGALAEPDLLDAALVVALASSVLPYSLELEALRRLPGAVKLDPPKKVRPVGMARRPTTTIGVPVRRSGHLGACPPGEAVQLSCSGAAPTAAALPAWPRTAGRARPSTAARPRAPSRSDGGHARHSVNASTAPRSGGLTHRTGFGSAKIAKREYG